MKKKESKRGFDNTLHGERIHVRLRTRLASLVLPDTWLVDNVQGACPVRYSPVGQSVRHSGAFHNYSEGRPIAYS